jgi:cytochrome c oxidase subunit 2
MRLDPWLLFSSALLSLTLGAAVLVQTRPRVIKVSARRWAFTPNVIKLRKGEPVALEVTSEDLFMGLYIPHFNVRGDIVPGKTTLMSFTPDKAGTFTFLCDAFCGDGHESMSGTLVVT